MDLDHKDEPDYFSPNMKQLHSEVTIINSTGGRTYLGELITITDPGDHGISKLWERIGPCGRRREVDGA
jgi:hypothetical protein